MWDERATSLSISVVRWARDQAEFYAEAPAVGTHVDATIRKDCGRPPTATLQLTPTGSTSLVGVVSSSCLLSIEAIPPAPRSFSTRMPGRLVYNGALAATVVERS